MTAKRVQAFPRPVTVGICVSTRTNLITGPPYVNWCFPNVLRDQIIFGLVVYNLIKIKSCKTYNKMVKALVCKFVDLYYFIIHHDLQDSFGIIVQIVFQLCLRHSNGLGKVYGWWSVQKVNIVGLLRHTRTLRGKGSVLECACGILCWSEALEFRTSLATGFNLPLSFTYSRHKTLSLRGATSTLLPPSGSRKEVSP